MAGKTNINELARRYVTAVIDLAGSGAKLKKLSSDLAELETIIKTSAAFKDMLSSPVISAENQIAAITEIGKKAKFDKITINFITVIAKNRRLENLEVILKTFKETIAKTNGELEADVISAKDLSAANLKSIQSELSKETKKKVTINHSVDPKIIGGLVIQIGSKMYDFSVKSRLERLRNNLKKAS